MQANKNIFCIYKALAGSCLVTSLKMRCYENYHHRSSSLSS